MSGLPFSNSEQEELLDSSYTENFPSLLNESGVSVLISSYQAGKIILIKESGGELNTHFVDFTHAMGVTADKDRLAIGNLNTVWCFDRISDSAGQHDTCYFPRSIHYTGHIAGHELGWGREKGIWLVNTYSCLCTLDLGYKFFPRWKPDFITELKPEDRCHLNGMAMTDGAPQYVTALGEADDAGAWRSHKYTGGILMSVSENRVLARGLSVPHSPRLLNNQLWFLESGTGSVCWFDQTALHNSEPERVTHTVLAELPGFTRGIDFVGNLAFIGLSQIRRPTDENNTAIPLLERLGGEEHSYCGVWVVDIRNGETVAFLRFEGGIQQIFSVQILRSRSPSILEPDDEHLKCELGVGFSPIT